MKEDRFIYRMSSIMAKSLLKTKRKEKKGKNFDENNFLCSVVNKDFGIKGKCVKVIVY